MNDINFKERTFGMCEALLTSYNSGRLKNNMGFTPKSDTDLGERILSAVCSTMLVYSDIKNELEFEGADASFADVMVSIPFSKYHSGEPMLLYYKDVIISMGRIFEICKQGMPDMILEREMKILSEKLFCHELEYANSTPDAFESTAGDMLQAVCV